MSELRELLAIKYVRDVISGLSPGELLESRSLEVDTKVGPYRVRSRCIEGEVFLDIANVTKDQTQWFATSVPLIPVRAYPVVRADRNPDGFVRGYSVTHDVPVVMDFTDHEVLKGMELIRHFPEMEDDESAQVYLSTSKGEVIRVDSASLMFMAPIAHIPTREALKSCVTLLRTGLMDGDWRDDNQCSARIYLIERALENGHIDGEPLGGMDVLRSVKRFFEHEHTDTSSANSMIWLLDKLMTDEGGRLAKVIGQLPEEEIPLFLRDRQRSGPNFGH